jgi:hypothetical protein
MQFHPDILNRYISPSIASFNKAEIPDLRQRYDQSEQWLTNHYLKALFARDYRDKYRQFMVTLLARAQTLFAFYHEARALTQDFLAESRPESPAIRRYYAAVARWESCFLNYQMFIDTYNKLSDCKAFQKADDTTEKRAYDIANVIKHWGGIVEAGKHDSQQTLPLWLSSDGFHTYQHVLSYAEFADILAAVGDAANEI